MSKKNFFLLNEQTYQNVYGKQIKLKINNYVSKACVEFLIENINNKRIELQINLVCLFIICNLYLYYYKLFTVRVLFVIIIVGVCLLKYFLVQVKNEKVLVIKSFGLQYIVTYYTGSQTIEFIPFETIEKIFINEVITLHRVLYFFTIMTLNGEQEEKLIPLFKYTKPRLKCLETIYKCINDIFYE